MLFGGTVLGLEGCSFTTLNTGDEEGVLRIALTWLRRQRRVRHPQQHATAINMINVRMQIDRQPTRKIFAFLGSESSVRASIRKGTC